MGNRHPRRRPGQEYGARRYSTGCEDEKWTKQPTRIRIMSTAPPGVRPCNKRPAVRPFNSQGAARFISQIGGGVAVDLKADADLDDFRCLPSQEDPSLYVFHPEKPVVVTMTKSGVRVNGHKVVGVRFSPSLKQVEDPLDERGIDTCRSRRRAPGESRDRMALPRRLIPRITSRGRDMKTRWNSRVCSAPLSAPRPSRRGCRLGVSRRRRREAP